MSNFDQRLKAGWRVWSADSQENPGSSSPPEHSADPRWMRELDQITGSGPRKTQTVTIKMLAPLLISAQKQNRTWLKDFADDVVVIDADLHEVLLAYQKLQHESGDRPAQDQQDRVAA